MKTARIVKWLGLLTLLLVMGAIVGGGILYATASASRAESPAAQGERQGGGNEWVTIVTPDESEPGLLIAKVTPDGPAAKAGLARGDILLRIDDQPVNNLHQLQSQLSERDAGEEVVLTVLHGDEERTLSATLEERGGRPFLGFAPCNDLCLSGLSEGATVFPVSLGAVIARVVPESPAEQAGLREGDRVIAVDDQELGSENDLEDLITAHQPGDRVTLRIERPGEDALEITAELAEHPEKEGVAYLGVEYLPLPAVEEFRAEIEPFDAIPPFDVEPFLDDPRFMAPLGTAGVFVLHIAEDSPAETTGLRPGDFITTLDGQPVENDLDLIDALAKYKPGDKVTLGVERLGEQPFEVVVELGEHPKKEGLAYLGVEYLVFPQQEGFEGNFMPFGQPPVPLPDLDDQPFIFQGEEQG